MSERLMDQISVLNKAVLVRTDYNVPMQDGQIQSDVRIRASLAVIRELIEAGASKIVLVSHLGRPKAVEPALSLQPVAQRLAELLEQEVGFVTDWAEVVKMPAQVVLCENLRFAAGEADNDSDFAAELVKQTGVELFIQDGFAVAHRRTATTDAVTKLLPSYASDNFRREYQTVGGFLATAAKPIVAIVGGAKVSDKIDFLLKLAQTVDYLVIGGAMANTFLQQRGLSVGRSLAEADQAATIRAIEQAWQAAGKDLAKIILPTDVVVVPELLSQQAVVRPVTEVQATEMIGDLGPASRDAIEKLLRQAGTVLWNGNLGYSENPQLATSSQAVIAQLVKQTTPALIGGGDTVGFVDNWLAAQLDDAKKTPYPELFLSTGGGASLELLAYGHLPGAEGLLNLTKAL